MRGSRRSPTRKARATSKCLRPRRSRFARRGSSDCTCAHLIGIVDRLDEVGSFHELAQIDMSADFTFHEVESLFQLPDSVAQLGNLSERVVLGTGAGDF